MNEISVNIGKRRARRRIFGSERDWIVISVKDNGIGIKKRELKKIFRKYYRSPGARDLNVSGVGLGLALCQGIVKRHGGWISVESMQRKGSTFSIYLPTVR